MSSSYLVVSLHRLKQNKLNPSQRRDRNNRLGKVQSSISTVLLSEGRQVISYNYVSFPASFFHLTKLIANTIGFLASVCVV